MNNGLKIILERMKTNPEEFDLPRLGRRWGIIVNDFWDIFTDEEKEQYREALRKIQMEKFEQEVLKELVRDEPRSSGSKIVDYDYKPRERLQATQLTLPLSHTLDD